MKMYAERLLYALEISGLSQSELARRIGVKPQNIQYLADKNKRAKGSAYTQSIAHETGVTGIWLEKGEGTPHGYQVAEPGKKYQVEFTLTAEEQRVIEDLRKLPLKDKKAYIDRIHLLAVAHQETLPDEKPGTKKPRK